MRVHSGKKVLDEKMGLKQFSEFHRTTFGFGIFCLVELVAAYIVASIAVDRGSPLYYLLAFILLVGAVQNFVRLAQKIYGH